MSTTVTYKGNTLTTATNQTRTLKTAGKYMQGDVVITDTTAAAPSGNIDITQAGVTNVTNYATATVPEATIADGGVSFNFSTVNNQRKCTLTPWTEFNGGYINSGFIETYGEIRDAIPSNTTIIPTTSTQTIGGRHYIMEDSVTINAIPSGYIIPTGNININQAGVTNVTNYATATVPEVDVSAHHSFTYSTSNNQRKCNIEAWSSIDEPGFTGEGSFVALDDIFNAVAANTTITPTTSTQTIGGADWIMEGPLTIAAMPTGVTTSPTSISGTAATVSTGTNTLTLTKTVSVTPRVTTAGYVSAGTAGNSSVSLTANVTTRAAATITPGTSNQTIASGTYLTGTQTISGDADLVAGNIKTGVNIFGVAGSYTSDATAAAADILSGQTAYVNGSKITGTLEVQNFYTGSSTPAANFGNNGDLYLQVTT